MYVVENCKKSFISFYIVDNNVVVNLFYFFIGRGVKNVEAAHENKDTDNSSLSRY
jgi:hypothetical protein